MVTSWQFSHAYLKFSSNIFEVRESNNATYHVLLIPKTFSFIYIIDFFRNLLSVANNVEKRGMSTYPLCITITLEMLQFFLKSFQSKLLSINPVLQVEAF